MKKALYIIIIMACMPMLVSAKQVWVPFMSGAQGAPPVIKVVESNTSRTIVHITIPGMYVTDTVIDGTTYQILQIPGYGTMNDIGAPQVPVVRELVAIPPIADAGVAIQPSASLFLDDFMVFPCQQPVPYGQPPEPFYLDTLVYTTNALYPDLIVERNDPAILRDMRIINLSSYPVSFNPIKQRLKVIYDYEVTITYHGINNINSLPHGYPTHVDSMFAAMYEDLVINYEWLGIASERSTSCDYLIITATEFYDDLADLVFWKHKKGCAVQVATPMDIVNRNYFLQSDTSDILNYIFEAFDLGSSDKECYLLFVGNEDAVPMYILYPYGLGGDEKIWSDHWYACQLGDDNYADIAVGRLSVTSDEQVSTIIDKIFAYERYPASDWAMNQALMVSHYADGTADFPDTTDKIIANSLEPVGFSYYDADGGSGWTNADIEDCIENGGSEKHGVGIVSYFGHGQETFWSDWNTSAEDFTTTDVFNLHNQDCYSIVYNCCCLNGAVQNSELPVMVEAWLRDVDGGGAGALGASQMTWLLHTYPNHFPMDLFQAPFNFGIRKIGWVVNYAKDREMDEEPGPLSRSLQNARMYNWFGDPELSIWTCPGECPSMTANHPANIGTGPQMFTVTVTNPLTGPVPGALVCLLKSEDPELWQKQSTNLSGQAVFLINPGFGGILYVTVIKDNFIPYEGMCMVWPGIDGPQSNDSTLAMPIAYALHQNAPNPFQSTTYIPYEVPLKGNDQWISIKIYDVNGRFVKTLVNQKHSAGYYSIIWDGCDSHDIEVSRGVYFIRFESEAYKATRKLLLIR
jgi:hypothetical protein